MKKLLLIESLADSIAPLISGSFCFTKSILILRPYFIDMSSKYSVLSETIIISLKPILIAFNITYSITGLPAISSKTLGLPSVISIILCPAPPASITIIKSKTETTSTYSTVTVLAKFLGLSGS